MLKPVSKEKTISGAKGVRFARGSDSLTLVQAAGAGRCACRPVATLRVGVGDGVEEGQREEAQREEAQGAGLSLFWWQGATPSHEMGNRSLSRRSKRQDPHLTWQPHAFQNPAKIPGEGARLNRKDI